MGRLEQSPRAKTLGNVLCCRVSLSTSTQPSAFTKGLARMASGADIGGVTCRNPYCNTVLRTMKLVTQERKKEEEEKKEKTFYF